MHFGEENYVCGVFFAFKINFFFESSRRTTIKPVLFFHKVSLTILVSYHSKLQD